MKKGGFLRNVLDTIRSNQANQANVSGGPSSGLGVGGRSAEFGGQLKTQHFALSQVARHGFPENPTALAFDPVQKIAAIGTKGGAVRVFGRPGVDVWAQHKPEFAVTHIRFIINQGAIITVTADESIHLWSLRGPNLKLQLSTNASQSPAQQSHSPASSNLSSISPQSVTAAANQQSTSAASSSYHHLHHGQSNADSGAQPGDPDYLSDQMLSSSPVGELYSRKPEILHTLKFQREHITCLHQTLMSKWLYIGTERGNVHVANVETFELSGYSIAWNKAIELSRKTHPGSIIHISECPQDTNKLLIGYESGCIVLWDLKSKNAEGRYYHTENLLWLAWHYEGKQFVAAHGDGSLVTWQLRSNARPAQVLHPHAKTAPQQQQQLQQLQQQQEFQTEAAQQQQAVSSFAAASFARALNNELYRPINKVEWKTSKNNEQFLLFSGGMPYDGLEQQQSSAEAIGRPHSAASPSSIQAASGARLTSQQSQQQQYLKASPASPSGSANLASPSPISPSISPSSLVDSSGHKSASRQSQFQAVGQLGSAGTYSRNERKSLRSTSLTVMYGKSITVLEMDETIIDFITICDNSPYENDTSDPYAVIVLLTNDLIIIDMTSSGYPSFESPYPAASLNESPVTCVHYLADCSSDLIPFLYSTSQNVLSRAPKKGFSDKEWPINGGEWGQPMQSYPELVLTGHADGTIKFWDMSGVNFDLISKIKTSKLFERPNKLQNSVIVPSQHPLSAASNSGSSGGRRSTHSLAGLPGSGVAAKQSSPSQGDHQLTGDYSSSSSTLQQSKGDFESMQSLAPPTGEQQPVEENYLAIEKIEYFPSTKHLLVAGALSQVIQFRLNKKEVPTAAGELTTILVEPSAAMVGAADASQPGQQQSAARQHLLLKARAQPSASGKTGSSSSSSGPQRGRTTSGFQAELICLTPLLVVTDESGLSPANGGGGNVAYYCQAPPKVTALALQATHSILAYAHEGGIVLVDIIQKCVIMSATLNDLYGGTSIMTNNRDISIQPFATSSILQHHYQSVASGTAAAAGAASLPLSGNNSSSIGAGEFGARSNHSGNNSSAMDNEASAQSKLIRAAGEGEFHDNDANDNGALPTSLNKSGAAANGSQASQQQQQQQPKQSRFTTNSMFQRQLSTTALNSSPGSVTARPLTSSGPRLFQRQMTASQLSSGSARTEETAGSGKQQQQQQQRVGANPATTTRPGAADLTSASSVLCLNSQAGGGLQSSGATLGQGRSMRRLADSADPAELAQPQQQQPKKPAKNKRIISRMLSISVIQTSVGLSSGADHSSGTANTSGTTTGQSDFGSHHHHQQATDGPASLTGTGDQSADKIDSSFTRSRSSSCSSTAPNEQTLGQHSAGESIQCLCFLDWTQATQALGQAASGSQHQPSAQQSASGAASVGGAHTSAANNKSLSSIDGPTAGQLALWLGTSQGSVLLVSLAMPDSEDNRVLQLQSVNAEPIPQAALKLPGAILCLAVFGSERHTSSGLGATGQGQLGSQTSSLEGEGGGDQAPGNSLVGSSAACASSSPAVSAQAAALNLRAQDSAAHHYSSFDSRAFLAIVSEKQAKVYQIPAANSKSSSPSSSSSSDHHHIPFHLHHHQQQQQQAHKPIGGVSGHHQQAESAADSPMAKFLVNKFNCISKADLSDSSFACRAAVVQMRQPDESCLVSYLATGNLVVHSLPKLRQLHDADFVPYTSARIASSMQFSRNGHCLYQPSTGEISKFTLSSQYKALVNEMTGLLYVPRDMPEMPRANFFKSLFAVATSSAASRQSERDELFGECSAGKPSRGVAKHISSGVGAGSAGLEKLKSSAVGTMGHDMRVAREGLDERGEKLGEIEDKTLAMMNQSESYSQAAHQLAQKFKDKKWYQF